MTRLVLLVIALAGVIYARSQVSENLHPWQGWWIVWVASTCLVAACIGWTAHGVYVHRG